MGSITVVPRTIKIVPGISLADRIAAGKFDWRNAHINDSFFPYHSRLAGEWEWKLFQFDRQKFLYFFRKKVSSRKVDSEIHAAGWQPALFEHLLVFREQYPEECNFPIVALRSTVPMGEDWVTAGIYLNDGECGLTFFFGHDCGWREDFRFLAVRTVSNT